MRIVHGAAAIATTAALLLTTFGGSALADPLPTTSSQARSSVSLTAVNPATALPDEAPATYTVTGVSSGNALAVRKGAGTSEAIVGSLANGASVTTTGKRASVGGGEWRQVTYGTITGWSSAFYLTKTTSTSTPLPDETAATYTVTGVSSGNVLAVRKGPAKSEVIVGTLANGATVTTTGKRVSAGGIEWRQVTYGTITGWSSAFYLTKTTSSSTPLPDETPATYTVTGVWSGHTLRMRNGPALNETIVANLTNGTTVATTGKRVSAGGIEWRQVTYGTITGWSSATYLTKSTSTSTPLPDEAAATYTVTGVSTGHTLRMRKGPSLSETIVANLANGTTVTTTGKRVSAGGIEWRQVTYGTITGWSAANYLTKS